MFEFDRLLCILGVAAGMNGLRRLRRAAAGSSPKGLSSRRSSPGHLGPGLRCPARTKTLLPATKPLSAVSRNKKPPRLGGFREQSSNRWTETMHQFGELIKPHLSSQVTPMCFHGDSFPIHYTRMSANANASGTCTLYKHADEQDSCCFHGNTI